MKVIAIVQARTASKRFPNKVLQKVNGSTLIQILLYRLSLSKKIGTGDLIDLQNKCFFCVDLLAELYP